MDWFPIVVILGSLSGLLIVLFRQARMIDRLTDQLMSRSLGEFVASQNNLTEAERPKGKEEKRVLRPVDSVLGGIR